MVHLILVLCREAGFSVFSLIICVFCVCMYVYICAFFFLLHGPLDRPTCDDPRSAGSYIYTIYTSIYIYNMYIYINTYRRSLHFSVPFDSLFCLFCPLITRVEVCVRDLSLGNDFGAIVMVLLISSVCFACFTITSRFCFFSRARTIEDWIASD